MAERTCSERDAAVIACSIAGYTASPSAAATGVPIECLRSTGAVLCSAQKQPRSSRCTDPSSRWNAIDLRLAGLGCDQISRVPNSSRLRTTAWAFSQAARLERRRPAGLRETPGLLGGEITELNASPASAYSGPAFTKW